MNIYPAILTGSIEVAQSQLNEFFNDDQIEAIQVDVIDGQFADNITITPADISELETGDLHLDFHLMVEEPLDYAYEIQEHKDRLPIRAVIAQIERMSNINEYVSFIKSHNYKVGLSLDIYTPVSELPLSLLPELDIIQLMGIQAGFQGQKLMTQLYVKLDELNQILSDNDLAPEVIVDGGVKLENIDKLEEAGVDSVVVGSEIWQADNPQSAAQKLQERAAE